MAKRTMYVCSECGHEAIGWTGKCPACHAWGSMEEIVLEKNAKTKESARKQKAALLRDVAPSSSKRLDTGIGELNRVLGGGLVPDSVVMVTAKPGAGKSTLLLEVAGNLSSKGRNVLYVSGEESTSQIKARSQRILSQESEHLYVLSTTSMDDVLEECKRISPEVLFIDSIQTMAYDDLTQRAGTPTQTVQVTSGLVALCKNEEHPMSVFLVGHMTKEDEMAGLRTLEHLVDVVLYLEATFDESLRLLRSTKNRFGYTGEVGLFTMAEKGLIEVTSPYALFVTKREKPVPGTALSLQREGSRMIPIEIESLVSPSYGPYPDRIGDSLRKDELNTLISILEQKAGYRLENKNVVLKATGGLKIREKVCDLAVLVSIVSSMLHVGIDADTAFLAEVGLTGELKPVRELERRIRELERLGFKRIYAKDGVSSAGAIEVVACRTLTEVLADIFNREVI